MSFIIVGLGNPGEEYQHTRHNTGRVLVKLFAKRQKFSVWEENSKLHALVSEKNIGSKKVVLVLPNTYMNKSGDAVKPLVKSKAKTEHVVIVHDDLDLPLGTFKFSFGRSAAGHHGVESIIKRLGTKDFVRLRVGVSAQTRGGKLKKPSGEREVHDHLMKNFTRVQEEVLKKLAPKVSKALITIITDGRAAAMNQNN